jgi:hypothetical protein
MSRTKLGVAVGVAVLAFVAGAQGAQFQYNVTFTIGDSGDGQAVGAGAQIPLGTFFTADGTWAAGNLDSLGDKTWSSSAPNTLSTVTPASNRFYGLTGSNGTSYYNPYDQVIGPLVDYSGDGESPDCTTSAIVTPYSCSKQEGKALKVRPTPVDATGPLPTASGVVTVDTVAGTLTGVLNYDDRGDGVAFDYRSGDGSPFNASQNSVSSAATLTVNFAGTFTASSWDVTGGTAAVADAGYVCTPGDLSGTLCSVSAVLGGHQLNGSHLSWRNVPVYDKIDTDGTRVLLTTIPGAVLTATLDGAGAITASSGEFHRALGSSGSNCAQDTVYDAANSKMSCGNLVVGAFNVTGALVPPGSQPVAVDDSFNVVPNVASSFNVLANDTLGDGTNTVTIDVAPTGGTASVVANAISYTASAAGSDSITYRITDGTGDFDTAVVSITAAFPPDTNPDNFLFNDQVNVAVNTLLTSNAVTIAGINQPAAIAVTNGLYSIGCTNTFTNVTGTITNGQTVCVQHTSAATNNGVVTTTLKVGTGGTGTSKSVTFSSFTPQISNGGGGSMDALSVLFLSLGLLIARRRYAVR